ncbi:hypothetical protein [uncultured Agrobacterium sp.]|uniref:hypothetical protein n=1 Tax=uncultured Agrobacterium sp. TaxID=157277 RepID=UPI0025EB35C0|nr:hypothetical protein [uncultured Agrobacterium sp.]
MALHPKTQLRKGIEQRLRDAVPSLAAVVSAIRAERTFQSDEVPLATVDVTDGGIPVGRNVAASRPVRRDMAVAVTLAVQGDVDDVEDALESLQVEVEDALHDPSLILRGLNDWAYAGSSSATSQPQAGLAVLVVRYSGWLVTAPGSATQLIGG